MCARPHDAAEMLIAQLENHHAHYAHSVLGLQGDRYG